MTIAPFDLTDGLTLLRLACGLFFIPHIYAKFFVPEALGFFVATGFKPPKFWLYVACVVEVILAVGLILGISLFYVGLLSAIHLTVAGVAVLKVSGNKWLWNIGGAEYCFFWAIACLVVALGA